MRDYGKVSPSFWNGETGRLLRKAGSEAQLIALYLLTCQSAHMTGLFYLPLPTLCHETGLSMKGAIKALARVSEVNFAHYDTASEMVWVPEMAHYQVGESLLEKDNRHKGILKYLENYRKSKYYMEFYNRYQGPFNLPNPSPLQAPCKGRVRTRAEQEQEQEQEQKQKKEQKKETAASRLSVSGFDNWWKIYPKKSGKEAARKAYVATLKRLGMAGWKRDATEAMLLTSVTAYAASPKAKSTYCWNPATWLNGGHYEDDSSVWQRGDDINIAGHIDGIKKSDLDFTGMDDGKGGVL